MRHVSRCARSVFGVIASGVVVCSPLAAQGPSMLEQLKAQYEVVKMGADAQGMTVVTPGTVFVVKKGGLLGVPPASAVVCGAKFENGELKAPGGFCAAMVKQQSRFFQVGEKVYATKIDVNMEKDKVTLQLIECDSCNNVQEPSYYKSEVVFQYPKGGLKTTGVPQVEDAIAKVLEIDNSGDNGGGNDQGGGNNGGNGSGDNGGQADQGPPPEPAEIEKGMTPDQVKNAIGVPDKIINLGAKQIYVYKDIKVTFIAGKVADVQ